MLEAVLKYYAFFRLARTDSATHRIILKSLKSSVMDATPDDYVLVDFEPLHKERWRSDTVRLVCAQFPPNTTCLWHQHLKYGIYVVMAPLDVVEQPYGEKPRPLVQNKGAVFCRDHTKDKLIHVATTSDLPAFLIEVELLKENADVKPNGNLPLHTGQGLELLYNEPECRVYRIALPDISSDHHETTEVSLALPTEAVVLALEDCDIEITSIADNSVRQFSLKVGDDVHLNAGEFELNLLSTSVKKTQFVLAEVY